MSWQGVAIRLAVAGVGLSVLMYAMAHLKVSA